MPRSILAILCVILLQHETSADVVYVDANANGPAHDGSSWCNAFVFLQDALEAAAEPGSAIDKIRLADGSYRPDQGASHVGGDRSETFLVSEGLKLYGGFAGCGATNPDERQPLVYPTVMTGDLMLNDVGAADDASHTDNALHVVTLTSGSIPSVLDGLIIKGGYADGASPDDSGAGVFGIDANMHMMNCHVTDSYAADRGGGMYLSPQGETTVTGSLFDHNMALIEGGGLYLYAGPDWPTVDGCTFEWNWATDGAAVFLAGDRALLTRSEFRWNTSEFHGTIFLKEGTKVVSHCLIELNSAYESPSFATGIQFEFGNGPIIIGCRIRNNIGGGISLWGGVSSNIINCLIHDNSVRGIFASFSAGAAVTHSIVTGNATGVDLNTTGGFGNSIVYHNGSGSLADQVGNVTSASMSYSCVQGYTSSLGGNGNIGADPLLEGDDFRPAAQSPCIDAGINGGIINDWLDLDGDGNMNEPVTRSDIDANPRYLDHAGVVPTNAQPVGISDMGCYEMIPPVLTGEGPRVVTVAPDSLTSEPVAIRITSPKFPCLDRYVAEDGSLADQPYYHLVGNWRGIRVTDSGIQPATQYAAYLETASGDSFGPFVATTSIMGDVDLNGTVNLGDILLIVQGFQQTYSIVTRQAVDIAPCQPNGEPNFVDILEGVLAFQGLEAPVCPPPCQ